MSWALESVEVQSKSTDEELRLLLVEIDFQALEELTNEKELLSWS